MEHLITSENVIKKMESLLNISSDFTRLKIMISLLDCEKCVKELVVACSASQSLISHQLKVLKDAKLVKSRREGTKVFYSLDDDHVKSLINLVYDHVMEESE